MTPAAWLGCVTFLPMNPDHGAPGPADFAALLRDARMTAGLTQEELAAKAGVGVRTVRDLERGRAARPQRTTVDLLAVALGLEGEEWVRFATAARGQSGSPGRDPAALPGGSGAIPGPGLLSVPAAMAGDQAGPGPTGPGGPAATRPPTLALPAPTRLIGRDRDVAAVAALLKTPGVVTLVGLAGVGKTSVGIAVLHRVAPRFPAGVAGITVTDGASEADLLAAIASVFGVGRAADIPARLHGAPALLMVDGVEQSGAVAEAVPWLCRHAPELRVLATGRRRLDVPTERVFHVEPLEVPPENRSMDVANLIRYPAAALFLARLSEVRREPVTDDEAEAFATLVQRLSGLPLALELAAARGRILDGGELLGRYGDRLLDLGGEDPSRGLREAVAGSYGLLDSAAGHALRQLATFRGRWSVELAEDILAGGGDPIAVLDRLVGLGLVTVGGSGPFRFRLLDVVREFALEEAERRGELSAARHQHAVVVARLAARTAPELVGSNLMRAINRLDYLASDLRAALEHAADDDPQTALCLASKLPRWWRFRGRDVPGRQWLRRLLDDPRTADSDPKVRAWAKLGVAQLAQEHGAGQAELPTAEEALAEFQALGHVTGELAARSLLCALWMANGGYDEARRHGEAALALATRTERVRDQAVAQNNLTWHEIRLGKLAAARRRLAAVDRLAAQCGELRLRVLARANLAEVARLEGRYDETVSIARAAGPLLEELGDPGHRRRLLGTIGLALTQAGRLGEAADVLAELRELSGSTGPASGGAGVGVGAAGRTTGIDGAIAAVEGYAALHRGDRELAAEWFAAAASSSAGQHDARDLVEALVGLAASSGEAERPAVLARLNEVCRRSGITLVPRERELLGGAAQDIGPGGAA
jgi:predicted ATPase/DNA-binding XRE family transcriptional regulator